MSIIFVKKIRYSNDNYYIIIKKYQVLCNANLIKDGSRLIENSGLSDAEKLKLYKKLYERSQKGEYRIMRGYIIRDEDMQIKQNDTGMIKFLDADLLAKGEMAERLINLKNIVSLTFKLTKYQLK